MSDSPSPGALHERSFEAFGVRVAVASSEPEVLSRLVGLLPADVTPCAPDSVERRFMLTRDANGWRYDSGGAKQTMLPDLTLATAVLDAELRRFVAAKSPERVFIHAGTVAYGDRAILIPGTSFSGKSTLVAALVSEGATYYSDEYALLDDQGLVHPYARPVSIRNAGGQGATRRPIESLGGRAGAEPVPVGLIAITSYRPGAAWSPERRSAGHGVITLLAHAMPARERPEEALPVVRRATEGALVVEGVRGEADVTAKALLELAGNGARDDAWQGR